MSRKQEQRYNEKTTQEVPEVAVFEEVHARYHAFRQANPEFFQYLDALAEEYNQKHEAADKAVRSQRASCGPFSLYQFATKYNPEELYQAVGHQQFLNLGGTMTTQTVYGVDKARVEANIKSGAIPEELAQRVKIIEPRFHKPEKIDLP